LGNRSVLEEMEGDYPVLILNSVFATNPCVLSRRRILISSFCSGGVSSHVICVISLGRNLSRSLASGLLEKNDFCTGFFFSLLPERCTKMDQWLQEGRADLEGFGEQVELIRPCSLC